MKRVCLLPVLLAALLLAGCSQPEPAEKTFPTTIPETIATATEATIPPTTEPPDPVLELLDTMSTEEKVGQLFLIRCPGEKAVSAIRENHIGGFILYGEDLENQTPESLAATIAGWQASSDIPMLIAVDEEGGTVCRVSSERAFRSSPFPSPRSSFDKGGMEAALGIEAEKAYLLSSLGINVNMAPVCDISTTPGAFMYRRSLGQDPRTTGEFALQTTELLAAFGVGAVWKHFPGYGDNTDTHTGIARDHRTIEELEDRDLVPFSMGVMGGCDAILMSHTIVTALDSDNPVSLSAAAVSYLRQVMGFAGVIVTDDLMMEGITQLYSPGEAATLAILAGNDLLCTTDPTLQIPAVMQAVESGRIPTARLEEAVTRILHWKQDLGLIPAG